MEFIEYDSFQDDEIPQPQPSLSIPIPSDFENFNLKLPKLNNLKSLLKFDEQKIENDEVSDRYAEISMKLIDKEISKGEEERDSFKETERDDTRYLSNKLSKVLNNSIDDSLIKELFSLDLNENELIDSNLIGSLSRKNLRSKIESRLIKNQSILLREYQPLIKHFKLVESNLKDLNEINNINNDKIQEILEHLNKFNEDFKNLNDEKVQINLKKDLLVNFKNKFLLNEFEEFTLNNNEINDDFFKILDKLDVLNENSLILLISDFDKGNNLGIKIIEKLNSLSDKSNEKLYNFAKRTLTNPNLNFNHEKLQKFQKILTLLNKRNIDMYDKLIKDFSNERSKTLIEEFNLYCNNMDDLINDSTRYIGDLLAYLHTMILNEMEMINSIFSNDPDQCNILMNLIFEKISKSLKSNFEKIISIELNFKKIYSVFNLFDLYKLMFKKKFNDDNHLIQTINELITFCQIKLIDLINNKLKSIKSSNIAKLDLNIDLQPPEWIIEFYSTILPIIEQSKLNFNSILNLEGEKLDDFFFKIINEPIEILDLHLKTKDFNNLEKIIIRINFVDLMLSKILPINLLNDKIIELNDSIESFKLQLSDFQYDQLLKDCQLYDFQTIINMISPFNDEEKEEDFLIEIYQPITENKLFTIEEIDKVNISIQEYLPNALMDIQKNLTKLNNPIISNDITETVSLKFINFAWKFNKITEEYLQKSLVWNDIEMATLLGVEEKYQK